MAVPKTLRIVPCGIHLPDKPAAVYELTQGNRQRQQTSNGGGKTRHLRMQLLSAVAVTPLTVIDTVASVLQTIKVYAPGANFGCGQQATSENAEGGRRQAAGGRRKTEVD